MTNLFLRYRASESDPWTLVPDITAAYPTQTAGALPVTSVQISSEPEHVGPGADGQLYLPLDASGETHLALRITCVDLPLSISNAILTFLLHYQSATYREAKHERFGQGGFASAALSGVDARNERGMMRLSFRLATPLATALTNV